MQQLSDSDFASAERLAAVSAPLVEALAEHAKQYNLSTREYGYLACTYLELAPGLYENARKQAVRKVHCAGTVGPKKEKLACCGVATLAFEYEEATRQEQVAARMRQSEEGFRGLTQKMQTPTPRRVSDAVTVLENMIGRILMSYSRYTSASASPPPEKLLYQEMGVRLFYDLAEILSEEVGDCPALRHFLSSSLELLGGSVVADKPDRCLQLVERIVRSSLLAEFLTPSFTPNVADAQTFLAIYEKIAFGIPDDNSSLAFVMMSKVS